MGTLEKTHDVSELKKTMIFIAMFVLLYEQFRVTFVERVKKHLCDWGIGKDNKDKYEETPIYCEKIKDRKEGILFATILWFVEQTAIEQSDYDTFREINAKRGHYVHKMSNQASVGIPVQDIQLFSKLLLLYKTLNDWCDTNIDRIGDVAESMSNGYMIIMELLNNNTGDDFYCKEILEWYRKYSKQKI